MIPIINKQEAARVVGVSPKTIYEWANKGWINKYMVKGCKTFKVSEAEVISINNKRNEITKTS